MAQEILKKVIEVGRTYKDNRHNTNLKERDEKLRRERQRKDQIKNPEVKKDIREKESDWLNEY